MRKPTVFLSIPSANEFKTLYTKCLKRIEEKNRVEIICFFDVPLVQIFERTVNSHVAYSNLVIGVLNGDNLNVSYELGLASGYGKPIILLSDRKTKVQSMLKQFDIIHYDKLKIDYDKLLTRIHESIDSIFYSKYDSLRAKTHGQLLIKLDDLKNEEILLEGEKDVLRVAIGEYRKKNFQGTIDVLTSKHSNKAIESENFYFFLCDSYFLESERMEEGATKSLYLQKMLETANRGLRMFPNTQILLKCEGLAHLKLQQLEPAKKIFEDLLEDYPNYDVARYDLACVYAQMGDLWNAIRNLSLVIDNDDSWRSLARLDPDFDPLWHKDLFQRLLYPIQRKM
jgi:tetratricopeptide (TPR) repeat protein